MLSVLPNFIKDKIAWRKEESGDIEVIKDRNVPVWKIADLHNDGYTIEKIADSFQNLTEKEVKIALLYYKRYRKRIISQIKARS